MSNNGMTKAAIIMQSYMEETGKCPICGIPMEDHPQCEACFLYCGPQHTSPIRTFRGHNLCPSCVKRWENKERLIGHEVSWEEFIAASPSYINN